MCTPDVLYLAGLALNGLGSILLVVASTPMIKKGGPTFQDLDPSLLRRRAYWLGFTMLAVGFVLQLAAQLMR